MADEKGDPILTGTEFQRWKRDYTTIAEALEDPGRISMGGSRPDFGPIWGAASKYYQLEELQLEAMALRLAQLPSEKQLGELVGGRLAEFLSRAQQGLVEAKGLGEELRGALEQIEAMGERAAGLKAKPAEDGWDDVEADTLEGERMELAGKKEGLLAELKKFLTNKSAGVRWEAVSALMEARDMNSAVRFAYAEAMPKNRANAVEGILAAVRLGAKLGREEKSMLLRMAGDMDAEIAEKASEIAVRLHGRGELDAEQAEYLLRKETASGGGKEAGLPVEAEAVEAGAEGKAGDAGKAAEQAAEPAAIRIIEIDDGADEEAGGPVTVLEIDDSVDEEGKPEEMRVLEMDDADIPIDPLKDAMGRLERGGMKDGEIVELVLLADGAPDKAERKRMFDKILKVLGPERQLGDGKADKILHAERILRFILETVSGGRPSRVPARRSVPPQEAGSRAPAEAQKAKC